MSLIVSEQKAIHSCGDASSKKAQDEMVELER